MYVGVFSSTIGRITIEAVGRGRVFGLQGSGRSQAVYFIYMYICIYISIVRELCICKKKAVVAHNSVAMKKLRMQQFAS